MSLVAAEFVRLLLDLPGLLQQAMVGAVPLALAGCGELAAQRAGVINVGIEGLMLGGCIAGFAVAALTGSAWLGFGAAVAAGALLAAGFAAATVLGRADQIVCGMAMNLLVVGISGTAWAALQDAGRDQLAPGAGFAPVALPGLGSLPFVGEVLAGQYGLAYAALALAAALGWLLARTRAGLIVRALGEAPDACAAAGVRVRAWRVGTVVAAGACAGAAGAYLSLMRVHGFVPEMTGGQGFLVLALVVFGRWRIGGLLAGCLLFGVLEAVQQRLQGGGMNAAVPYQLFKALPYLAALAALALLSRSAPGPAKLGQAWPEGR